MAEGLSASEVGKEIGEHAKHAELHEQRDRLVSISEAVVLSVVMLAAIALLLVALIAAGCSNEEVAQRLEISARTAKAHSDALRQKLGVPRRRQIPAAFRRLTGEDPLEIPLGSSSGDR